MDTNILLRIARPTDPDHALIRTALRTLHRQGERRCYTSQNLVEFWNVCTRPPTARGGFGFSLTETDQAARLVERLFTFLPDDQTILTKTIDVATAQMPLSELVSLALTGAEVVLAEGATPLVCLALVVPVKPARIAGLHEGAIWTSEDFDAPLPDEFKSVRGSLSVLYSMWR